MITIFIFAYQSITIHLRVCLKLLNTLYFSPTLHGQLQICHKSVCPMQMHYMRSRSLLNILMSIEPILITEVDMRFLHLVLLSTVCSIITGVLSAFTHLRLLFSISVLLSIPGLAYIAFAAGALITLIIIELLHKFRRVNRQD